MTTAIFDSHGFVERLTAAGMHERQAEILAEEHAALIDKQLATKDDVAMLKSELVLLGHQLTIRVGVMLVAAVGVLATLVKLP